MSNHHPHPNHSRPSLPRPTNHAATSRSLTPLVILFLLLPAAAAQTDTAAPPPPDPYPYGQRFNSSMAVIMVVLVSAFFLMGFVSVYIRQCAENRFWGGRPAAEGRPEGAAGLLFGRGSIRGPARGLDESVMESFPTFPYSSVKGLKIGKGSLECAVCLNEFEDDDVLRLLPRCNHVFHSGCIDAWLSSHATCPVCRANLVPKPGEKFDPPTLPVAEPEPGADTSGQPDHVCIFVEDEHNVHSELRPGTQVEECSSIDKARPPRSRSTGMRFMNRLLPFPRSHSTGHSLVQPGEDRERFTLRLPNDVRDHIIQTASLNRAKSCVPAFPRVKSARSGYRRSGSNGGGRSVRGRSYLNYERFDQEERTGRWGFSMTPPFIGKSGSVRSAGGGDGVGMTPPRSVSKSEKSPPFDRMFIGMDGDDGERSFDRLRPPGPRAAKVQNEKHSAPCSKPYQPSDRACVEMIQYGPLITSRGIFVNFYQFLSPLPFF